MEKQEKQQQVVIIGGGPAGLTGAYEILQRTSLHPLVLEASQDLGGISRTINYKGNRMDIGGHRFFSKNEQVMSWWTHMMPMQGKPAHDDLLLHQQEKPLSAQGPDPEKEDRVMLVRERVSRIFYLRHFFDYPISLKLNTFKGMGLKRTLEAGAGYMWSTTFKKPENSLENFYINRFGAPLYRMFFEDYTEKVWGIHPSKLGADWGAQRVKGLSIRTILLDMIRKQFSSSHRDLKQKQVETSLIEQFIYPKLGPGQLWETVGSEIEKQGGTIRRNQEVTAITVENNRVTGVTVHGAEGDQQVPCDYLFSSMPLCDLIAALRGIEIPTTVKQIAASLPYRDFITVGLLVNQLHIRNETKLKTWANRVPDTWIYIQERDVKIGRLQVFNNWSPYLVNDYENTVWIGLEYFCAERDSLWQMDKDAFIAMAIGELEHLGILDGKDVMDSVQIKVKKAYPAYYGSYYQLDQVKKFLDSIDNLYCIGRNGQHRYNNMDHSMLTAMAAVDYLAGKGTKKAIWEVNTEEVYHEQK